MPANQRNVLSAIVLSAMVLSSRVTRAITTPAGTCIGAQGATSYWACVVASLPGHRSKAGARGTGA